MPVTKLAEDFIKEADGVIGPIIGGVRASKLNKKEKKTLTDEYGLDEGANLTARNAGRGFLGGALGSVGGSALGMGLGALTRNPRSQRLATRLSGAAGGIGGATAATNKYSKGRAAKLREDNDY